MKKFLLILVMVLSASFALAADVDLKWEASTGAMGYKIYKSEDSGITWETPLDVGNVTTYKYLNVIETKMVIFKVSAYNEFGESVRHWSGAWYDHRLKPLIPAGGMAIP